MSDKQIRDQRLFEAFKRFLEAALGVLGAYRVEEGREVVEQPEFLPDGGVRLVQGSRPRSLSALLNGKHESLQALREFQHLRDLVAEGSVGASLLTKADGSAVAPNDRDYWLYQYACFPLLSRYLSHGSRPDFDEVLFRQLYDEVEAYCYSSTIRMWYVAPLFNFALADEVGPSVELAAGFCIRKLTSDEKRRLWIEACDASLWGRSDLFGLTWAAELSAEVPKVDPAVNTREEFEDLECLLRLLHSDSLHPATIRFLLVRSEPRFNPLYLIGGQQNWRVTRSASGFPSVASRQPSPSDTELMQEWWKQLKSFGSQRRFSLALRQYSAPHDKARPEQQLLDLWIALETLFLPDGLQGELRYRAALRVAHYLGSGSGRTAIFEAVRNSYDWRSFLVHGGNPESPPKRLSRTLQDVVSTTSGYLKVTLEKVLDSGVMINLPQVDRSIIEGEPSGP